MLRSWMPSAVAGYQPTFRLINDGNTASGDGNDEHHDICTQLLPGDPLPISWDAAYKEAEADAEDANYDDEKTATEGDDFSGQDDTGNDTSYDLRAGHGIAEEIQLGKFSRMALLKGKLWKNGQTILVRCIGGNPHVHQKVATYAKEWEKYANLRFRFVRSGESDIRITFDMKDGWHSIIGKTSRTYRLTPTMNLALDMNSPEDEFRRHVLHEFGHALGCVHEHSSPAAHINWDKKKVYAYYKKRMGWEPWDVDRNILQKYDKTKVTQFTKFDPKSIMVYSIPASLTHGTTIGWNTRLSETDKRYIAKIYPKPQRQPVRPNKRASDHTYHENTGNRRAASRRPQTKNPGISRNQKVSFHLHDHPVRGVSRCMYPWNLNCGSRWPVRSRLGGDVQADVAPVSRAGRNGVLPVCCQLFPGMAPPTSGMVSTRNRVSQANHVNDSGAFDEGVQGVDYFHEDTYDYEGGGEDAENYHADVYDLDSYNAADYGAEDYGLEDFDDEDYDAENYDAEDYDSENYAAAEYDAEDYDAEDYDAEYYDYEAPDTEAYDNEFNDNHESYPYEEDNGLVSYDDEAAAEDAGDADPSVYAGMHNPTSHLALYPKFFRWDLGSTIIIRFIPPGPSSVMDALRRLVRTWEQYANIKFRFDGWVNDGPSHVRISFDPKQNNWSYVGKQLGVSRGGGATMNFNFPTWSETRENVSIVWHEFGHVLGCVHELASPVRNLPWNKDATYAYYQQTMGWGPAMVDQQVFKQYTKKDNLNYTPFDSKSIMCYSVPSQLLYNHPGIPWNYDLSPTDILYIKRMYPRRPPVRKPPVRKPPVRRPQPRKPPTTTRPQPRRPPPTRRPPPRKVDPVPHRPAPRRMPPRAPARPIPRRRPAPRTTRRDVVYDEEDHDFGQVFSKATVIPSEPGAPQPVRFCTEIVHESKQLPTTSRVAAYADYHDPSGLDDDEIYPENYGTQGEYDDQNEDSKSAYTGDEAPEAAKDEEEDAFAETDADGDIFYESSEIGGDAADIGGLTAPRERLAIATGGLYQAGSTIIIKFIGGTPQLKNLVKHYSIEWTSYANIKFKFINQGKSHIRISFRPGKGNFAPIGKRPLSGNQAGANMNLDIAGTSIEFARSTILHEFGHVLGCIHEHQSPKSNYRWQWNKEAAINYYKRELKWDKKTVMEQIINKYTFKEADKSSRLDEKSIMTYAIPKQFTTNGVEVRWPKELSRTDKAFIARMYPFNHSRAKTAGSPTRRPAQRSGKFINMGKLEVHQYGDAGVPDVEDNDNHFDDDHDEVEEEEEEEEEEEQAENQHDAQIEEVETEQIAVQAPATPATNGVKHLPIPESPLPDPSQSKPIAPEVSETGITPFGAEGPLGESETDLPSGEPQENIIPSTPIKNIPYPAPKLMSGSKKGVPSVSVAAGVPDALS